MEEFSADLEEDDFCKTMQNTGTQNLHESSDMSSTVGSTFKILTIKEIFSKLWEKPTRCILLEDPAPEPAPNLLSL